MSQRLRFGVFLAPYHKPGVNPTLALQNDLELIQMLDRNGYDEAWIGEHHSAGSEIIGSPEIFMATAAERTQRIRLGTGVLSVPYHNPLWIADRLILLDHLTRGRVMLGVGPGALPTDAAMIGLDPTQTRPLLEDGLAVLMKLLTTEEPVTFKNDRWTLNNARTQLRPYSSPIFDIAAAAVASPAGARLTGRHGIGMLSFGATTASGFDALAHHWNIAEDEARVHGKTIDRAKWRLVGMVHIAETMQQAYRDVEYGIEQYFHYMQKVVAVPQFNLPGNNVKEMIDLVNDTGLGAIGTPEMCTAQIHRLMKQSNGGFGAYLLMAHNWANTAATHKSYELIARHVMPHFQGHHAPTVEATARAIEARPGLYARHELAVEQMQARHDAEVAARVA